MTTDNFGIYLQNRLIQTSRTGGQQHSDTSPFSIPCLLSAFIVPAFHPAGPSATLPACLPTLQIFPSCQSTSQYVCLSARLPVCPPACLPACLSACLPVCPPACLPACLSAHLPVCPPACLPACLSARLPVCPPACLPACLSARLPVYPPACLPACLSTRLPVCHHSVNVSTRSVICIVKEYSPRNVRQTN